MDTNSGNPILMILALVGIATFFGMAGYGAIWLPLINHLDTRRFKREHEEAERRAKAEKAAKQQAIIDSVNAAVEEGSMSWDQGHTTVVDDSGKELYTFAGGELMTPADLRAKKRQDAYNRELETQEMIKLGGV
jgi:hypothetical protein